MRSATQRTRRLTARPKALFEAYAGQDVREARGPAGSFGVEPSLVLNKAPHPGVPLGKWLRNTLKEIESDFPSLHVIDVAQTRLGDVAADVVWAVQSLAVNLTQVEYLTLTERVDV